MIFRGLREWFKVAEVMWIEIIGSMAVFYLISAKWPMFLDLSYQITIGILVIQAALSYCYTTSVYRQKKFVALSSAEHKPVPRATFIISAYLPNEVTVIEATILNILNNVERPAGGIEVIVAYNTPHMEDLELRLRQMAFQWPELVLANAYESRSKSENLNYSIDFASGQIIVLLDADHLVAPDCLRLAWRWLDEGYDVVQGRCKIRNAADGLIPNIVGVEFEVIYGIQHPSKSIIFDMSLFGGSNGYWKAEVIKAVRFDPGMLTEDIDSTLRGTLAGYRFVADRSIISTELSPTTVRGLWSQRKRWSQGWLQCSLKYQWDMLKTPRLNYSQKFMWTTLLLYRVIYDIVSTFIFPIVFAFWIREGKIMLPMNGYIAFSLIFTMLSGPYQGFVAFKNAASPRAPMWHYLLYALFVWPYTVFKIINHFVAIRDELAGERPWVISTRTTT